MPQKTLGAISKASLQILAAGLWFVWGFGPEDILTLQSSRQTVLEKVTALSCGWSALLLPGVGALGTAEDRKGLWGQ